MFWGGFGDFFGTFLEGFFGDIGAKMVATWAKLEPSWQQVAPKMGHVSAKMAMLGSIWEALVEFWKHFWSILADALATKLFEAGNPICASRLFFYVCVVYPMGTSRSFQKTTYCVLMTLC